MFTHEKEKNMLKKMKMEFRKEDIEDRISKTEDRIRKRKKLIKNKRWIAIDHNLNKEATKWDGFLHLSYIYNIFERHSFNFLESWIRYEITKKGPVFIQGFDKNHLNIQAIQSVITSGFLDDKDIQNDLGLKSKRQADRILTPSSHSDIKYMNYVFKHIPTKYIVRVWHIKQNSKFSNRIYGTGRRPQKVISVEDYLKFLLNYYKDIVPKEVNINKYYTKFGKQLVHKWKSSSNQNRELMFLIQFSYIQYIKRQNPINDEKLLDCYQYLNKLQYLYFKYMRLLMKNTLKYYKISEDLKRLGYEYLNIFQYREYSDDLQRCKDLFLKIVEFKNVVSSRKKKLKKNLGNYLVNDAFMDLFRERYPTDTRSKLFTKHNTIMRAMLDSMILPNPKF